MGRDLETDSVREADARVADSSDPLWRGTLISSGGSLHHAISNLQKMGIQITMVVSQDGALVGTVTDGDVRRGLLRGLELDSPVTSVMRTEPLVVPPELSRAAALQLMKTNVIGALPVVDEERRVVGLHLLNELLAPDHHSNVMVIMAGGKGTRLRPQTNDVPKPLLRVGDKPMVEHILERARAEGFSRFVLAVHYLAEMVEEYFGDGSRWEVEISYLREDSPLGTAGALGLLRPKPDAPILVSNCDVLTGIRYGELLDFHCRHGAAATMAVRLHELKHPFGVVRTKGVDIIGFEEKPISRSHINAGVYVLEPTALDAMPREGACDMPTLFSRLSESGSRTIAFPMHEPWLDIGRADDLERAQADHANGAPKSGAAGA
jgi:dTDP-glucose pyrophosphorylase/CBS domain-containing protein